MNFADLSRRFSDTSVTRITPLPKDRMGFSPGQHHPSLSNRDGSYNLEEANIWSEHHHQTQTQRKLSALSYPLQRLSQVFTGRHRPPQRNNINYQPDNNPVGIDEEWQTETLGVSVSQGATSQPSQTAIPPFRNPFADPTPDKATVSVSQSAKATTVRSRIYSLSHIIPPPPLPPFSGSYNFGSSPKASNNVRSTRSATASPSLSMPSTIPSLNFQEFTTSMEATDSQGNSFKECDPHSPFRSSWSGSSGELIDSNFGVEPMSPGESSSKYSEQQEYIDANDSIDKDFVEVTKTTAEPKTSGISFSPKFCQHIF